MNGVNQKNFGLFFTICLGLRAAKRLIKADRSDKSMIKNVTKNAEARPDQDKWKMKPKFFLQISDHQQSLAASWGLPHIPGSSGGR